MQLNDFDYHLPEELIAQKPVKKRDQSRLLVLDRKSGKIEHTKFNNILEYLNEGDCLVLNNTKVMPARLLGEREDTGGKMEFVLLRQHPPKTWEVLVKPGRNAKPGRRFVFGKNNELKAKVIEIVKGGNRIVEFEYEGNFNEILDRVGIVPLPPYIVEKLEDKDRYQTVYAKDNGSAAAPTAGLHFTKELLKVIRKKGVKIAYVTLHVGLGTFRPVKTKNIKDHKMHSEFYYITKENCDIINKTTKNGNKIVCVGTTSCRVLESISDENGNVSPFRGETDIFIYPGYKFKIVNNLITNFHLPKSTLLMLVSALAGRKNILNAYNEAVQMEYRFFSFGDAMFITNLEKEKNE